MLKLFYSIDHLATKIIQAFMFGVLMVFTFVFMIMAMVYFGVLVSWAVIEDVLQGHLDLNEQARNELR